MKRGEDTDKTSEDERENTEEEIRNSASIFSLFSSTVQWLFWATWTILTFGIIAYVVISGLVLYSREVKMEIIFSNRIPGPLFANFTDCKGFGILNCENFYLDGSAGKLGAWFISPASKQYITREAYILYLHGNMGSRALDHRVQLYKRLSKMGYHILVIDYRGFGDSEGWPTEQGLVEDGKVAYNWLLNKAHGHAVYIWGHSLGSAVGVQLAALINTERTRLNGVFLESPFNNMTDGIKYSPLAAPLFRFMPSLLKYTEDVKNVFKSTFWIQKIISPVLILHDVKDHIINVVMARRLHTAAKSVGTTNVKMLELDENLYHNDIYKASHFKEIVNEFIFHTS